MNFLGMLKELELDRLYFVREVYHVLGRDVCRADELVEVLVERFKRSGFVSRHAKLKEGDVGKEVEHVEAALGLKPLGLKLFDRDRNRPWRNYSDPASAALVRQIMDDIDAMLAPVQQLYRRSSCFRIRVGCTKDLGEWPLTATCAAFCDELISRPSAELAEETGHHSGNRGIEPMGSMTKARSIRIPMPSDGPHEFDLLMTFDLPQHVRFEGTMLGQYDLIVASRHPEKTKDSVLRDEIEPPVKLPMRLLINRKHEMAERNSLTWDDLNNWTLLLEQRRQNPRPVYPREAFPPGLHVDYVQSTSEAVAALRAAGASIKTAYLGFPHLLKPDDRLELRSFQLERLDDAFMTFGVAISQKAKSRWPTRKKKVVNDLALAINRRFERIRNGAIQLQEDDFQSLFRNRAFVAFYVTHKQLARGNYHWLKARLGHVAICEDSSTDHFRVFFRGDLDVANHFDETKYKFDWNGEVYRDDSRMYHISAQAKLNRGPIEYEDFSVALTIREPKEPWVGYWMGQSTFIRAERLAPSFGYFLIWPDQQNVPEPNEWNDALGKIIAEHKEYIKANGGVEYALPIPGHNAQNLTLEGPVPHRDVRSKK